MADEIGEFRPGKWVVAATQPRKERFAQEHLERQGFEPYCPLIHRRIRHARRYRDELRPLFPGYVFVRVALNRAEWRPICSTYGVRKLIRFGEEPALLEDQFIEALKAREKDGAIAPPAAMFKVGEKVKLTGGAFEGLVATILEVGTNERLLVLMDMLQRGVRTTISTANVLPTVGNGAGTGA